MGSWWDRDGFRHAGAVLIVGLETRVYNNNLRSLRSRDFIQVHKPIEDSLSAWPGIHYHTALLTKGKNGSPIGFV